MFDKHPQASAQEEETINFLHGEENKSFRQRPKAEPVELTNAYPLKPERDPVRQKPHTSFFRRFVSLFTNTHSSERGHSEKSLPGDTQALNGERSDPLHLQQSPHETSLKATFAAKKKEEPRGVVDVFEKESLIKKDDLAASLEKKQEPLEQNTTKQPSEDLPAHGVGEIEEWTRGRLERFKKTPLSELVKPTQGKSQYNSVGNTRTRERSTSGDVDVNLLPAQKKHISLKTKKIICLAVLSVEFVVLLFLFVLWQARADGRLIALRDLESRATQLEIQTKGYKQTIARATELQKKVSILKNLFVERNDPMRAFSWLEANTLKSVFLESFSTSGDGAFSVEVAANDVQSAAQQLKIFLNAKEWKSIAIGGLEIREDETGVVAASYGIDAVPVREFYHPSQSL